MTSKTGEDRPQAPARAAEIVREFGPFAGADRVHGVTQNKRLVPQSRDKPKKGKHEHKCNDV
jgi:hypothetical protein